MTFLQHLSELRVRLLRATYGVLLGGAVFLFWSEELFHALQTPFRDYFAGAHLIGTGPAEAFVIKLKIALLGGFFAALPWIFTQAWLFVLPGLHEHERKLAVPFIASATGFFLLGAAFCFFGVLPFAFQFFAAEFSSVGLDPQIRIAEYLSFVLGMVFVFGLMFEMPLLAFLLTRIGVLHSAFLTRNFRYAVVIIFIVAALLTPPDVVTQCLLALPLIALYGLSILVAQTVERKRTKRLP